MEDDDGSKDRDFALAKAGTSTTKTSTVTSSSGGSSLFTKTTTSTTKSPEGMTEVMEVVEVVRETVSKGEVVIDEDKFYEREDVQKKTFAKWINSQLAKGNHPLVTDLFYDLRDGTRLLGLLEVLTGSTYKREKGKMRVHHLNNVSRGLNILEQHNVKLVNISNDDIVDGSAKLTLGLVWSIILHWQVQGVLKDVMADLQQTNLEKTLLAWCRQTTKGYHGVDVRNFTTSWTDGLAFNALIHRHRPDLFDWPTVAKKLPFARLEQAFRLANKEFGIERLLDPEDVNTQVPDKKSMMMYIMCLFQALPKASFTMESLDVSIQSDSSFSLEASGGDEKNRPLSTVSIGLGGYQRTLEEVLTWLLGAEDRLAAMPPIAEEPEEVKQQFHQLEDLMLELTAKQGGIGDVLGEGTRLLKEGVMGEEEEEEVRVQMKLLNTRWEDLRVKAMDRQTQLHDCLMQLQQSQLENLKSWLTATEDRISKMSEVGPTTEDLKAQVVAHHKLQQDLEGEQANINSLSNMVVVVDEGNSDAAYSNLEDELNALGERWAHICRWAEQRWTTLQVLTVHWEQLEREMEKLGKWLDENEAQLKQMESNPSTDQEHLLRQAGTLQVLQSEMDIQQRRFALLQEESSKVLSNLPKDSPAQTKIPETLENLQDRWDCLVAIIEAQNQRLAASGIDIKRTDFPSETDGSVVSSSTSTITHEGATMITKVITTKTTTTKHVEEGSFKRQKLEGESYEEFNVALNQLGGWMDTVQERLQPKQTDDLSYEQLVQLCQHLQDEVQTQQEEYNKVMSLGQSAISETATIGECSSESESKVTDFAARWQALSEMMANLQSRIEFMAERKKLTAELSAMEIHYQGFQRWFDNVRTVSENEPNAITSQVEQCKTKIAGMKSHEQRLNEMNQTVSNLSSKWPIEAAAIVHSGKEFIEKWEALLLKFVDWGNALSSELEKQPPQSYLEALTALKRWLTNVEAAVTTEPLVISKLPVLSDQLQNYKELLKTVEVEESSLAYINRTGNELLSRSEVNIRLKGDLVELNKRWESAVAALKSRVENVEKAIEMLGQYRDEVSGLKSWLAEVDVFLHAEDAALGDIETLEAQLEQSNALQDDISTLETNVNNIKTTSGHIIQETNDEELRNEVSQQVKDLSDRWDVVLDLARRQNKSLKDALAKSQKVHEDISKLNMWLDKLELEFPPVKPIETSSELSSVIGVISKLREDIANHTDTFRSVNEIGNEMLQYENVTSHDDMARQFTLLNGRWTDIISQIDRRHKTLTKATEQYAQFQVLCEEETSWLDQLEQKLEKSSKSAADAEEISEALDDLEIFLHGHHEERLQKVQELAEQLVQEGVMTFAVQNSTHDLTSRFNSLNAQANEQRTTLEGGVQEAQAWEREYISVLEWLTHTDVVITQAVADPSTHLEGTDEVLKELTRQQEVLAKMEAQVQVYQSSGKLEAAQRLEDQVVHLKKKYEEVQGKLQQLNSAPSDFDVRLKTMDAQLHDISQNVQLVSLTAGNPTAIQDQLNLCLQLYRTLSEVKGEVESVIATGRKIVKENQTSNPEGLTQQLDQLKALYNELGKAVTEQRGILEQSLRQSKKILKDGQHLEDWLSTTEHELDTREATVPLRSVQHELHFAQSEQDEKKDEMEKFIVGLGEVKGWLEVTENKLSNLTKYPAEERANIIKKVSQEVQDYKGQIESIRDTSVELISHGELFESRVQPELVTINQRWEHIFKTVTVSSAPGVEQSSLDSVPTTTLGSPLTSTTITSESTASADFPLENIQFIKSTDTQTLGLVPVSHRMIEDPTMCKSIMYPNINVGIGDRVHEEQLTDQFFNIGDSGKKLIPTQRSHSPVECIDSDIVQDLHTIKQSIRTMSSSVTTETQISSYFPSEVQPETSELSDIHSEEKALSEIRSEISALTSLFPKLSPVPEIHAEFSNANQEGKVIPQVKMYDIQGVSRIPHDSTAQISTPSQRPDIEEIQKTRGSNIFSQVEEEVETYGFPIIQQGSGSVVESCTEKNEAERFSVKSSVQLKQKKTEQKKSEKKAKSRTKKSDGAATATVERKLSSALQEYAIAPTEVVSSLQSPSSTKSFLVCQEVMATAGDGLTDSLLISHDEPVFDNKGDGGPSKNQTSKKEYIENTREISFTSETFDIFNSGNVISQEVPLTTGSTESHLVAHDGKVKRPDSLDLSRKISVASKVFDVAPAELALAIHTPSDQVESFAACGEIVATAGEGVTDRVLISYDDVIQLDSREVENTSKENEKSGESQDLVSSEIERRISTASEVIDFAPCEVLVEIETLLSPTTSFAATGEQFCTAGEGLTNGVLSSSEDIIRVDKGKSSDVSATEEELLDDKETPLPFETHAGYQTQVVKASDVESGTEVEVIYQIQKKRRQPVVAPLEGEDISELMESAKKCSSDVTLSGNHLRDITDVNTASEIQVEQSCEEINLSPPRKISRGSKVLTDLPEESLDDSEIVQGIFSAGQEDGSVGQRTIVKACDRKISTASSEYEIAPLEVTPVLPSPTFPTKSFVISYDVSATVGEGLTDNVIVSSENVLVNSMYYENQIKEGADSSKDGERKSSHAHKSFELEEIELSKDLQVPEVVTGGELSVVDHERKIATASTEFEVIHHETHDIKRKISTGLQEVDLSLSEVASTIEIPSSAVNAFAISSEEVYTAGEGLVDCVLTSHENIIVDAVSIDLAAGQSSLQTELAVVDDEPMDFTFLDQHDISSEIILADEETSLTRDFSIIREDFSLSDRIVVPVEMDEFSPDTTVVHGYSFDEEMFDGEDFEEVNAEEVYVPHNAATAIPTGYTIRSFDESVNDDIADAISYTDIESSVNVKDKYGVAVTVVGTIKDIDNICQSAPDSFDTPTKVVIGKDSTKYEQNEKAETQKKKALNEESYVLQKKKEQELEEAMIEEMIDILHEKAMISKQEDRPTAEARREPVIKEHKDTKLETIQEKVILPTLEETSQEESHIDQEYVIVGNIKEPCSEEYMDNDARKATSGNTTYVKKSATVSTLQGIGGNSSVHSRAKMKVKGQETKIQYLPFSLFDSEKLSNNGMQTDHHLEEQKPPSSPPDYNVLKLEFPSVKTKGKGEKSSSVINDSSKQSEKAYDLPPVPSSKCQLNSGIRESSDEKAPPLPPRKVRLIEIQMEDDEKEEIKESKSDIKVFPSRPSSKGTDFFMKPALGRTQESFGHDDKQLEKPPFPSHEAQAGSQNKGRIINIKFEGDHEVKPEIPLHEDHTSITADKSKIQASDNDHNEKIGTSNIRDEKKDPKSKGRIIEIELEDEKVVKGDNIEKPSLMSENNSGSKTLFPNTQFKFPSLTHEDLRNRLAFDIKKKKEEFLKRIETKETPESKVRVIEIEVEKDAAKEGIKDVTVNSEHSLQVHEDHFGNTEQSQMSKLSLFEADIPAIDKDSGDEYKPIQAPKAVKVSEVEEMTMPVCEPPKKVIMEDAQSKVISDLKSDSVQSTTTVLKGSTSLEVDESKGARPKVQLPKKESKIHHVPHELAGTTGTSGINVKNVKKEGMKTIDVSRIKAEISRIERLPETGQTSGERKEPDKNVKSDADIIKEIVINFVPHTPIDMRKKEERKRQLRMEPPLPSKTIAESKAGVKDIVTASSVSAEVEKGTTMGSDSNSSIKTSSNVEARVISSVLKKTTTKSEIYAQPETSFSQDSASTLEGTEHLPREESMLSVHYVPHAPVDGTQPPQRSEKKTGDVPHDQRDIKKLETVEKVAVPLKQEAETAVLDMKVGTHKEVKQKDSSLPSTSKVVTHVMTKTTITTTSTSSSSSSQVPRPDEDQVDIYLREVSSMSDRITALKYKTKDIPHFNEAKEKVEGLEHEVALLEPDVATVISRGDTLTLTTHMVDVPRANSIRLAVNDLRQQWSTLKADTEHLKNETDLVNQEIENYPERVDVLITWLNEVTKRLDIVNNDESQLEALEREMASKKEEIDKINETGERMKKYQYAQLQPIITLINTRWTELTMQFRQYRKVPHETKTIVPGSKDSTVLEPSKVPDYVASVNRLREAISAISRQLNAPLMNGREFDNLNAQEEELKVIKQGLDTLKPRVDSTETEREAVMSSATPSEADQVRRVVDKLRQEWAQVNRGYTEHHARWLHASESIRALHKMTEDFSVWLSSIEEKVQITANQPLHEAKITQKDLEKQVTLKHRPSQNLQTKCKEITEEMNVDDGRRLQDHVDNLMKRWRSLLLDLAARRERIATEETGKDTSTDYEDLVTWLDQVQGLVDAPVNVTDEASLSAHITMVQNHVIECGGKQVLLKRLKEGKSKGVTPAQIATLDMNMTKIANLLPEYKSNLDTKQGVIKTLGDNVEDLYKWTEEMRVRVALHNLTQDEIKQMRATLREKTAWYESLDSTYWVLAQDAESKGLTVSVDLKNRMNSIESRLKALQAQLAESSAAGASTSFAMAAPVEEQENKKKVIVEAEVEAVKEDDMASSMSSSVTSSVTTVIHNVKMEESVLSTEGDMRPPSPLVCPPKHSPDSSPAVVLASLDKSILQIRDWLTLVEQMVKQQTAVVGDSDDIRTLIEKQKSVLRELESKKPQLDELVASADSLKDEDSRTQLHQKASSGDAALYRFPTHSRLFDHLRTCFKVSKLREHWDETNSSVLQRKTQLDVMMADTHKFYTKRVEVDTWLMRLEARMERMAPVAHTADILDQQIREQKGIHAELHQYKHQMELFNQMTQRLITIYQHDDTRKIKKITETINMRYSNLSSSIIARGKVLHSAMNSLHNFDKALDKFRAWLSETESLADQLDMEVDKLGPGRRDMQPRRPSIHLKDLQSEIESHKDVLASLNATGQKLLGTLDNQDEAVMLQRRLEEMNQRWNNLKHKSMAIRNRLEGNAENWNSLLLSLRELIEWVIRKDTELNALGPLVGDISSLSKYEEDLSVFRRVLDEKQPVIESNLKSGRQLIASEPPLSDTSDSEAGRDLDGDNRYRGEETARDLTRSVRREVAKLSEKWAALRERAGATASQANLANKKLGVLQKTVEEVGGRLEDAEKTVAAWGTVPQDPNLADQHVHNVKKFREGLADLQRGVDDVNDQAARFSAHNVPLTPANSARLHDLNNRWKTLETTVNDRWRQLAGRSREVTPMTPAQLASSVAPPWERATASNKVPYYINHDRESTHWDHPDMMELLDSMAQYNHIKFSAYRTAMKLRTLQKKLALEYAKLQTATGIFDEHGLRGQNDRLIDVNDMVVVLSALYASIASDHPEINTTLAMDLCLNWLLNVYDSQRTGQMRVLSFKVGLVCLCTGHLEEKYRYMFRLIADLNRLVDQRKLGLLLHDCVQVPRQLGEVAAFGGSNIEPSVRSCFTKAGKDRETIEAVHFLSWVQQEPQSLVWLAVLHRVAASENVHHQVKCNICKAYPVVGLRYRCLKCLSFDMCQQCFFGGRSNKSHKVTHPMHEYCTATTTGEDMKDFTKALKNKFKSKRSLQKHAKKGYLPVQTVLEGDALESPAPSPQHNVSSQDMHTRLEMYASRLAEVELRTNSNSTPDSEDEHGLIAQYCQSLSSSDAPLPVPRSPLQIMAAVDAEQKEELEAMIRDLEEENKVLQAEYDRLKAQKPLGSPPEDFGPQGRSETDMIAEAKLLREHKGRLEARMSILEEHNRQLEAQLHRLRQLLEEPSGASSPNKSGTLQTKSVTASQLAMDSPAKVNGHSTAQGGSGGPYEGLEQMSEYVRPPPPPLGSMSHVGNLFSRAGDLGKAVGTLVATMTDEGEKDSRSSHHSTEDSE